MSINPLQPPIPRDHDTQWQWGPLAGSAAALAIANLSLAQQKLLLLITTSVSSAEKAYREITFFVNDATFPVYVFPDWETLPYDHFSPHEDIVSERLQLLYRLPIITHGIVIVALPAIMQRLAPCAFIQTNSCLWSVGDCINLTAFKNQLSASGYHCVEQVMQHGEFSVRGGLIDLFPMGSNAPYRIELFDDIIDTIRLFDPDTQCSIKQIKNSTSANSLRAWCETPV